MTFISEICSCAQYAKRMMASSHSEEGAQRYGHKQKAQEKELLLLHGKPNPQVSQAATRFQGQLKFLLWWFPWACDRD